MHSESAPSSMPKLPLHFSSSASSASSQPPYHHLSFRSFLSSLFTLKTQNLSFQFRNPNPNPKIQDGVKMSISARLGAMRVQENPGKTKWSSGGESVYLKTETLTSKSILDSQIRVQNSSINNK